MLSSQKIRQIFLKFFKEKGHKIIPSSSLIPADSSVLFTSAGMQQFIPYLSGKIEPPYKRACSIQKCLRTADIEEVGDNTHLTFFEMLGNWSFGDYYKKEAIDYALEILDSKFKIQNSKLWITIFKGENDLPRDDQAYNLWIKAGIPKQRIKEFGIENNFWGPVEEIGPCGPCSEIHYDRGEKFGCGKKECQPNCQCGRFVEIWNLVFMELNKKTNKKEYTYESLPQKNIDTGIGFERLTAILQNKTSLYETDLFLPIIQKINQQFTINNQQSIRIIADHLRASCFLITEGILPSNLDRGYILRRLIRRIITKSQITNSKSQIANRESLIMDLIDTVIKNYENVYPELRQVRSDIITVFQKEEEKFAKSLKKGIKEFEKLISRISEQKIPGKKVFNLYESHGLPLELIEDLAKEKGFKIDKQDFYKAQKEHQEISRTGVEKKFGKINKEISYQETKLHTATHLLHQALRQILGKHVRPMGSDINPERLRFDFFHPKKMIEKKIKKVEDLVNQKIKENLIIKREEMPLKEALNSDALSFFKERYPEKVSVYSIGDFSKEICVGPHVERTGILGKFKIIKEKSAGKEIRRIKAILT